MREIPLVLLVDDEDIFLEIASTKLSSAGFTTERAHSVSEAVSKALELIPDFVLSDVYMGDGKGGWDLITELRHNERTKNIKFAFFTSLRDPWMELKKDKQAVMAELGQITFLSKTEDVDVLPEKISHLVRGDA